ncbi:hypothetical protein AVEN_29894-1 [Araneus ventricosus]|uniref:Uncharacterized protein n=1 Tax=Araneus ventricosus TaxID=182803 RepID=A0A4Y2JPF0_ARAVE|nr:hypothetical protein AVEN_29894-1 [Araneus ventricosus]
MCMERQRFSAGFLVTEQLLKGVIWLMATSLRADTIRRTHFVIRGGRSFKLIRMEKKKRPDVVKMPNLDDMHFEKWETDEKNSKHGPKGKERPTIHKRIAVG